MLLTGGYQRNLW